MKSAFELRDRSAGDTTARMPQTREWHAIDRDNLSCTFPVNDSLLSGLKNWVPKLLGTQTPAAFRELCQRCNQIGELAGEMGFTAGLHNLGQMVQNQDEIDGFMAMTNPKLFGLSPDTCHLNLAGCDVVGTLNRYKQKGVSQGLGDGPLLQQQLRPGRRPSEFPWMPPGFEER